MSSSALIGNGLAWLLPLPGNLACDALGLGQADNRDLVRMLVNSLVWMVASIVVAVVVMERMMRFNQITDDAIRRLVDDFYAKVRADPELGPVFARDPGDWTAHLATMRDFWSSVMLTSGHYKGNPVAAHRRVEGIELPMFKRWLALFDQTCGELFEAPIADAFRAKATRIAESLKLAMFYRPDRPWPGSAV